MAICDRLNHSVGGELKKYIRNTAGQDMFCGRICAGLHAVDPLYAILPYRYKRGKELNFAEFVPNYEKYPPSCKVSFFIFYLHICFLCPV